MGKWKCRKCGFKADMATWKRRVVRTGGLLGGRKWYACPNCNQESELSRA